MIFNRNRENGGVTVVPLNSSDRLVRFTGAHMDIDDDGHVTYSPWDDVVINTAMICAVYDHTIVIMGHKIRVMGSMEEILEKIRGR